MTILELHTKAYDYTRITITPFKPFISTKDDKVKYVRSSIYSTA